MPTLPHLYHSMLLSHHHSTSNILSALLHPLLRVAAASFLIWYLSGKTDQPRFKCAVLFGISVGFATYVELSPFLLGSVVTTSDAANVSEEYSDTSSSADAPFALVALQILTVTSFLVGTASGSLLPRLFLGVCCGGVLGLLVVALIGSMGLAHSGSSISGLVGGNSGLGFFPVVGGGLALIMGGISCR